MFGKIVLLTQSRRGRDRMVVGFTTTSAINAYHHINLSVRAPLMARCTG